MSKRGIVLFVAFPIILMIAFLGLRGGFSRTSILAGLTSLSPDQLGSFLSGTFGVAAFVVVVYQTVAAEKGLGAQVRNMGDQLRNMADQLNAQREGLALTREGQNMEFKAAVYQAFERVVAEVMPLVESWIDGLESIRLISSEERRRCGDSFEEKMFLLQARLGRRDARQLGSPLYNFIMGKAIQQSFRYFLVATDAFEEFCGGSDTASSIFSMYKMLHFQEIRTILRGLTEVIGSMSDTDSRRF